MDKITIGLAMVMQNDETHIPATLSQFYHVVDDIVVVDGGSGDASISWAERMGARVFHKPFAQDFSAQKNYAIENLKTDWIYLHKCEERLEPPMLAILPKLVTQEGQYSLAEADLFPKSEELYDCFGFSRKSIVDGLPISLYPDYQYRLFKNYCRYRGIVDEKLINSIKRAELVSPELSQGSYFNILRYQSSTRREQEKALYLKVKGV